MTRTQVLLVVLACLLLAIWLTGGNRPGAARSTPAGPRAGVVAADPALDGIAQQAARLRVRLSSPPPLTALRRNPFQFRDVTPAVPSPKRPPVLTTALGERPARPDIKLLGIAEDSQDGVPVRTAILSAIGQLFFAKEGDRVLARYQVVRVAVDAVQLKDGEGETFTLALK